VPLSASKVTAATDKHQPLVKEMDPDDENIATDDDLEGWVDEVEALTEEEQAALQEEIWPVSCVLVKVCIH